MFPHMLIHLNLLKLLNGFKKLDLKVCPRILSSGKLPSENISPSNSKTVWPKHIDLPTELGLSSGENVTKGKHADEFINVKLNNYM